MAVAHGMRVLALKRNPHVGQGSGYQWKGVGDPEGVLPVRIDGPEELHELLGEADFVVNCLPLTPATRGVFGAAQFRTMKPTAYFINVGRAGTVHTEPLVEALRDKLIAGAGLDDFGPGNCRRDAALWEMGNVFISPHISGTRRNLQYLERTNELFCENLRRYLNGEPLYNVVTRERGY